MSKWRQYVPAIQQLITSSESYVRDPYAVTILTVDMGRADEKNPSKLTFKGLGFAKRVRYRKILDAPDPEFGKKLSSERAFKDLYNQLIGEYKPLLDKLSIEEQEIPQVKLPLM